MSRSGLAASLVAIGLAGAVPRQGGCASPTAAVWEIVDPYTSSAGAVPLLAAAGFEVVELSPSSFTRAYDADAIVLGSFVSEDPAYGRVMRRHAAELTRWVSDGGVLVQFVQSAHTEPQPPFLPGGLIARREDIAWNLLRADSPSTPLLDGLVIDHPDGPRFPLPGHPRGIAASQTFADHIGWTVHLWSDPQIAHRDAALLEAAHGRGRILLVAIPFDKLSHADGTPAVADPYPLAASIFASNLSRYVTALAGGTLPAPVPTSDRSPAPREWTDGSWSVVVVPDSQFAAHETPEVLEAQIEWIAAARSVRNIRFVVHEGDVTHTGARREWRRARRAFDTIDGVVPYAVTTGNHDYTPGADLSERRTELPSHFGRDVVRGQPTFGGLLSNERPENQFHTFDAGGRRWLIMTLEYLPSTDAVRWADDVLTRFRDHETILVTHSFLDEMDRRIDLDARLASLGHPPLPTEFHDGEDLWRELVSRHPNVRLVLSGHVTGDGAGRRTDVVDGRPIHQILANYQMRRAGGEGWLRILEFLPDGRTLRVHTYSPWLDRSMTDPQNQFELELGPWGSGKPD